MDEGSGLGLGVLAGSFARIGESSSGASGSGDTYEGGNSDIRATFDLLRPFLLGPARDGFCCVRVASVFSGSQLNGFEFGSDDTKLAIEARLEEGCTLPEMWRKGVDGFDTKFTGRSSVASWPNVVWRM
jgi:hypothetical protein